MNRQITLFERANAGQRSIITTVILTGIVLFLLQGCTLRSTHNKVVADLDACKTHDVEMTDKLTKLQNTTNSLIEEIEERRKAEVCKTKIYNELINDLDTEIGMNQLKIKLMKSGVNVNLPHDVLFTSGSAELSKTGVKVISKVGAELADIPYQVIVGGYTDNVPVSAKLADRYPTNWELAGARAARVVRGLEEAGVAKERLRAMSLADNIPIASNDTPEGRAQNRRIQIVLRPVVPDE